ncbi:MAG: hypothetical protein J6U44_04490 [Paludibacteraceae bacterium]|nr:hypothetical protein [Paludibacteraceae bacterium]
MAIDFDKVETVFEHNLTKEEIISLFYFEDTTRESYIETIKRYSTEEQMMISINCSLYYLFRARGNHKKAMEYADRLPECDAKYFSVLNHCF